MSLVRTPTTFRILVLFWSEMNVYIIQWLKKDKKYSVFITITKYLNSVDGTSRDIRNNQ